MEEFIKEFAANLKQTGTELAFNFPGFHSSLLFNEFNNNMISINESIAYASAWGASQAGEKSLVCFRELGLNIAADNYINSLFTGIGTGLVVVVFSDTKFEGSQCVMESSNYARFGGIWLKPYNHSSLIVSSKIANLISSSFNLPVVIEIANEINHSSCNITGVDIERIIEIIKTYSRDCGSKIEPISHPVNAYNQYCILYEKNKKLGVMANEINKLMKQNLAITYPLKDYRLLSAPEKSKYIISTRYEKIFKEVNKYFDYICGDIGEFTKDTLNTITHALSFGSSIPVAMGMSMAGKKNIVAIVGDGAFFHSARNAIDELLNRGLNVKIILIDNGGLYSTGGQKISGVLPTYVEMLELDFSADTSDRKIIDIMKRVYMSRSVLLLKINIKI